MPRNPEISSDLLLAHAGFVRALARSLLSDEAEVEDVVQETWLRALRDGPRRKEALTKWLRTVTRNLAIKTLRSRDRRGARERTAAKKESLPSAAELVEREGTLESIVGVVLSLPEHYRQVVLLRYFEDLPPRKIAARLDVPVNTVRMRLHRAHKLLRGKLDDEHGGERDRWERGLALLAGIDLERAKTAATAGTGAGLALQLGAIAVVLVSLSLGAFLWLRGGDGDPATSGLSDGTRTAGTGRLAMAERGSGAGTERTPAGVGATTESTEAADATPTPHLVGRVVDGAGAPVPGADVYALWRSNPFARLASSGDDGTFELPIPADVVAELRAGGPPLLFGARAGSHGPSAIGTWSGGEPPELVITLRGRGASVRGHVVDRDGRPIPGARVTVGERFRLGRGHRGPLFERADRVSKGRLLTALVAEPGRYAAFQGFRAGRGFMGEQVLLRDGERSRLLPSLVVTASADGGYRADGLEAGTYPLVVVAPGCSTEARDLRLAEGEQRELDVVLTRGAAVGGVLRRRDGLPLEGGNVYCIGAGPRDRVAVKVARDGRFRIDDLPAGPVRLYAEGRTDLGVTHSASGHAELVAGEAFGWEPLLDQSEGVRFRLIGPDDRPLADWRAELRLDDNPSRAVESATSDGEGRLEFATCPPFPTRLYLFHPRGATGVASHVVADVEPGAEELVVRVPRELLSVTSISGRLRFSTGGTPPEHFGVIAYHEGSSQGEAFQVEGPDGHFASKPLPPGHYRLVFPDHGLGHVAEHAVHLEPGGDLELGTLELPALGGLTLLPPAGIDSEIVTIQLARVPADGGERVVIFDGRAELPVRVELGPGLHALRLPRRDEPAREVVVRAGREESIELGARR